MDQALRNEELDRYIGSYVLVKDNIAHLHVYAISLHVEWFGFIV